MCIQRKFIFCMCMSREYNTKSFESVAICIKCLVSSYDNWSLFTWSLVIVHNWGVMVCHNQSTIFSSIVARQRYLTSLQWSRHSKTKVVWLITLFFFHTPVMQVSFARSIKSAWLCRHHAVLKLHPSHRR